MNRYILFTMIYLIDYLGNLYHLILLKFRVSLTESVDIAHRFKYYVQSIMKL